MSRSGTPRPSSEETGIELATFPVASQPALPPEPLASPPDSLEAGRLIVSDGVSEVEAMALNAQRDSRLEIETRTFTRVSFCAQPSLLFRIIKRLIAPAV